MTPFVHFRADPRRKLLWVEMEGFFTLDDVATYAKQRNAAYDQLGCRPGEHVTLCDIRKCKVSSQEVLAAFSKVLSDPASRARRIAFLTGSGLMRQQIRRMVDGGRSACFADESEALAWLAAD